LTTRRGFSYIDAVGLATDITEGNIFVTLPVATGWTVGASVGFADSETDKDGGAGEDEAQAVRAAAELSLAHEARFASDGQSFRFIHEYRVGVTHEEALDDRQVGALGLGAPLTLQGDDDARTLVTFGADLSFKLSENAAIFAGYDGELGSDYNTHSINGGFRINW
jgi:hypothetical protein